MKLHEKIYYYRKKAGLSQDALADKLGISRQAISKWETAESVPETGKLAALALALGISVDWLLSEDEPEGETNGAREYDAGTFVPGRDASSAGTAARSRTRGLKHWAWLSGVVVAAIGAYLAVPGRDSEACDVEPARAAQHGTATSAARQCGSTAWRRR